MSTTRRGGFPIIMIQFEEAIRDLLVDTTAKFPEKFQRLDQNYHGFLEGPAREAQYAQNTEKYMWDAICDGW